MGEWRPETHHASLVDGPPESWLYMLHDNHFCVVKRLSILVKKGLPWWLSVKNPPAMQETQV